MSDDFENEVKNEGFDEQKKQKKGKKDLNPKNLRVDFNDGYNKVQSSIPAFVIVCIAAFFTAIVACCAVFFINLKGPEQVLVPNVEGKTLEEALLEMQVKELYPKISLRYSDVTGDEGTILEQSPKAGAIVKGYSRVSLVVSKGIVIDEVGNYIGKTVDEVQMQLQTLFAGKAREMIVLAKPEYKSDQAPAGTILEQDPPEGYKISSPVTVHLVVSKGPVYENTKRPYVVGLSIAEMQQAITRSKIIFDITGRPAAEGEKPGTVVAQQEITDEYIPNYSRVTVEMAMPDAAADGNVSGVFTTTLDNYPYTVPMRLDAVPDGEAVYTVLSFSHIGGNVTIPYTVAKGTTLILYVDNKVKARTVVQ